MQPWHRRTAIGSPKNKNNSHLFYAMPWGRSLTCAQVASYLPMTEIRQKVQHQCKHPYLAKDESEVCTNTKEL